MNLKNMGIKTCIKCGKGGNVLVCRSSHCIVAIHESCCNRSSLQVHDRENFFCPYCLYKQSVTECCQAKDKAVTSERKLALFLGAKMSVNQEHVPNITMKKGITLQNHKKHCNQERERKNTQRVHFQQSGSDLDSGKHSLALVRTMDKKEGCLRKCKGSDNVAMSLDCMKPEESNLHLRWEGEVLAPEPLNYRKERISSVECQLKMNMPSAVVGEELDQFPQHVQNYAYGSQNFAKNQHHLELMDYCSMEKGMELESSGCNLGDGEINGQREKKYDQLETSTSSASEGNSAEITENRDKGCNEPNAVNSGSAGWIDKPNKKILDGVPFTKRKRVRWSAEEEEMLKKGVLFFSSTANKNLPWRKILVLLPQSGNGKKFHSAKFNFTFPLNIHLPCFMTI
ncbi:hypothetical protein V2J09_006607 [Rumex salicifolius]